MTSDLVTTQGLREELAELEELIAAHHEALRGEPRSFAYRLALQSLESRRRDLENALRQAQSEERQPGVRFEVVPLEAAMLRLGTGRRAEITKEYLAYIDRLAGGQAGRLQPGEGETIATVRRRLGAAARVGGKNLVIKRLGDELYFWTQAPTTTGRRRGRPRRTTD